MKFTITDNTPDNWCIEEKEDGEFESLKEAKKELIEICKTHILTEKEMIKSVKKFKL